MGPPEPPLVLLITVWRDAPGVRARIVHGDRRASSTRVCGSVPDLLHAIDEVVDAWRGEPTDDPNGD